MMQVVLIVVAVIIILYFISKKKSVKYSNPIDTIRFDGCMGFKLGDSKDFVFSRIKHLSLMNEKEKELHKYRESNNLNVGYSDKLISSELLFNNIENVIFYFEFGFLRGISIKIKPEQMDITSISNVIKRRINRKFGDNSTTLSGSFIWKKDRNVISFDIDKINDSASIYITDKRFHLA